MVVKKHLNDDIEDRRGAPLGRLFYQLWSEDLFRKGLYFFYRGKLFR